MITQSAYVQVSQRGTLDTSHAQTLGIDVAGIAAILNILTNMYSNPALAVVREYSCNARDSHVEAGKRHLPIEVSLPTAIDPQLRVQDYGLGLSGDEILNTYAKYGSSTKRTSNELIGAMGIGSKSAFTVGNQFTVTGVKDGRKTVALFALNAQGEPTVDILFEGETDEPNGVLVDIGVENIQAVRDAAAKLFYTWDQGTVHVDGERPDHVWVKTNNVGDGAYLLVAEGALNYDQSHINIVMGGVSYKLNQSAINSLTTPTRAWLSGLSRSHAVFYIDVPIGSVDITPSREDLRVTPTTTATVEKVIQALITNLPKWINAEIESAETFTDAAVQVRKLRLALGWTDYKGLSWRGRNFDTPRFQLSYPNYRVTRRGHYADSKVTKADRVTHITMDLDLSTLIVVTDVPAGKETTVRRYTKAILLERDESENNSKLVIASPESSEDVHWFSYGRGGPVESITFEDWRELGRKLLKTSSSASGGRAEATYEVRGEDDNLTASDIIALGEDVAYYAYKTSFPYRDKIAEEALADLTVVMLSKGQREETLVKRLPGARSGKVVVAEHAETIIKGMTAADKEMVTNNRYLASVNSAQMNWLLANKDRITSRAVLKHIRFHEEAQKAAAADQERLRTLSRASQLSGISLDVRATTKANFVTESLPLLALYVSNSYQANSMVSDRAALNTHIIDYVNHASI
jgi:hypothetical protein